MKLSISNIGWSGENDLVVYQMMKDMGFKGLEIAPTRIFPENPYDRLGEADKWSKDIKKKYGFAIPSMQSIWYGRSEKIFGSEEDRSALIAYTKKAIVFAETIGCGNLVFGCRRNRSIPDDGDIEIAISFFKEIGDYAYEHHTVVAMEANPPIYNTNYINETKSAIALIEKVESDGFKLNLDIGTMIANEEDVSVLYGKECLINHVHVSEPGLKTIERRLLHRTLFKLLTDYGYEGFVSIEVGNQKSVAALAKMMKYTQEIFG